MSPRYAVIPTRNRPEQFEECLAAITDQVDYVIVVSHGAPYATPRPGMRVLSYPVEELNLSEMWNLGLLDAEMGSYAERHLVAVLNDDAIVPPSWFDQISLAMRESGAVAGSSIHPAHEVQPWLLKQEADSDIVRRLAGYAFILDGAAGLRADEQFRWWWGDTDLDWCARHRGGTVLVPGVPVAHPPNGGTAAEGVLADTIAVDRERFIEKWGSAPW